MRLIPNRLMKPHKSGSVSFNNFFPHDKWNSAGCKQCKGWHRGGLRLRCTGRRGGQLGLHHKFPFYAATASLLNFPVYFSENLDSFDELMNDLGWLEEKSLRIYISEYANFLLEEPVKKRRQVLDILAKAALGGLLELYLIKSAESLDDLNQQKLEFTEVSEEA